MTYGRWRSAWYGLDFTEAAVSHSAELVRGSYAFHF